MKRKLASVQRIKSLEPIEGADAIEKATVLGWQLVVKKGEFQAGDLCVYCEIDSLMPDKPPFEFLKPRAMRIRTVRLRGQISQGICFPLSMLPPDAEINEDADVTEMLGIVKYEPPVPESLTGTAKGGFPSFIPKTDETRVQVLQEMLSKYKGTPCYVTEKLDGTSVTFFIKDGVFGVCSRNLELLETSESVPWKIARQLNIETKLRALNRNLALQGELIGAGVQGNKYKLKTQAVFFFTAFDIDAYRFLDYADFAAMMKHLELQSVPIASTAFELTDDIDELVSLSVARSQLNAAVWREGVVIRPLQEKTDMMGRVSFKVINPEFLLKYD
ncbi:MAG: RNA ligase (ATP) [Rhizobacter sp.]|nr:RNA ligase (ATP) [Chlorobiales bacterium]